jgi:hypothetical protein
MTELKKIKSIDPNLEAFNELYKSKLQKADPNERENRDLNEIEILMEILTAADTQYKPFSG